MGKLQAIFENVEKSSRNYKTDLAEDLLNAVHLKELNVLNENSNQNEFEVVKNKIFFEAMTYPTEKESLDFIETIEEGFADLAKKAGTAVKNTAKKALNKLKSFITNVWEDIKGPINTFLQKTEKDYQEYKEAGNLFEAENASPDDVVEMIMGDDSTVDTDDEEPIDKFKTLYADGNRITDQFATDFSSDNNFAKFILKTAEKDVKSAKEILNFVYEKLGKKEKNVELLNLKELQILADNDKLNKVSGIESVDTEGLQKLTSSMDSGNSSGGSEGSDEDSESEEEKGSYKERLKVAKKIIEDISNNPENDPLYKKLGLKKSQVWNPFFKVLKTSEINGRFIPAILEMENRPSGMTNEALPVFFSFVPTLIDEYANSNYVKQDDEYKKLLGKISGHAAKLQTKVNQSELASGEIGGVELGDDVKKSSKAAKLADEIIDGGSKIKRENLVALIKKLTKNGLKLDQAEELITGIDRKDLSKLIPIIKDTEFFNGKNQKEKQNFIIKILEEITPADKKNFISFLNSVAKNGLTDKLPYNKLSKISKFNLKNINFRENRKKEDIKKIIDQIISSSK